MKKLIIFDLILIILITIILVIIRHKKLDESKKHSILLISSLLTIFCHYSSLLYHFINGGITETYQYLLSNPNLVFPIYPCNLVMLMCIIFPFLKNKENNIYHFFIDYIYCFGLVSCLVGLFANVDFIRNPDLLDYDVTKGILAHAFMLFNVLLFPTLGLYKLDLISNMKNILISILFMFIIGTYCNLLASVFGSLDYAYQINSMFLIHSPFEDIKFINYSFISFIAIIAYFIVFAIAEQLKYPKNNRWYNRLKKVHN